MQIAQRVIEEEYHLSILPIRNLLLGRYRLNKGAFAKTTAVAGNLCLKESLDIIRAELQSLTCFVDRCNREDRVGVQEKFWIRRCIAGYKISQTRSRSGLTQSVTL
jgi:hypothetical protein